MTEFGWKRKFRIAHGARVHLPARVAATAAVTMLCGCATLTSLDRLVRFAGNGRTVELRASAPIAPSGPTRPRLLLIAIDGVDRDLLYDLLRSGRMPALARLVDLETGGRGRAHLEQSLVAAFPSSTALAWATAMSGVSPGRHGIAGNELFLREEGRVVAPVPGSIEDPSDVLAIYTDDLVNRLLLVPSVYERMRARDPGVRIWVAMHQIFRGADLLLLPERTAILDAFRVIAQEKLQAGVGAEDAARVYQELDSDVVGAVRHQLEAEAPPDVLTVYLPGNDLYAHVAKNGPDPARRDYLSRVVDPLIGELADALRERDGLRDRWTVVTSDHGHTAVIHDDHHSLGVDDAGEPAQVLSRAGFRVRPFALEVKETDYDAVLAYQGAVAYVYLADRSTCLEVGETCDWTRPPRYEEDVLEVADAFHRTNETGLHASEMVNSLEMVLVRDRGVEAPAPFRVYVGGGRLESVHGYLASHPRPNWVDFERRLQALGVGAGAERVGDVVLIARAGDEWPLGKRRYFAPPYRSYHGSPARKDSEIPLIIGHPTASAASIRRRVAASLDGHTDQSRVAHLLFDLRYRFSSP